MQVENNKQIIKEVLVQLREKRTIMLHSHHRGVFFVVLLVTIAAPPSIQAGIRTRAIGERGVQVVDDRDELTFTFLAKKIDSLRSRHLQEEEHQHHPEEEHHQEKEHREEAEQHHQEAEQHHEEAGQHQQEEGQHQEHQEAAHGEQEAQQHRQEEQQHGQHQEVQQQHGSGHNSDHDKYNWAVRPKIFRAAAFLSMFGSLWIIIEILRDIKKRKLSYHRLVFALSLFDLAASASYLAYTLIPKGSDATACEAPGFFIFWGAFCTPWYNAALATYFYLSIIQGWREHRIQRQFERFVHYVFPLVGLIVAVLPASLGLHNPFHQYCFAAPHRRRSMQEQQEQQHTYTFVYIFRYNVLVTAVFVTLTMIAIYCCVRKTLLRSNRYTFAGHNKRLSSAGSTSNQMSALSTGSGTTVSWRSGEQSSAQSSRLSTQQRKAKPKNHDMLKSVRTMAFLYTIPYYATWVVPVIWMFVEHAAHDNHTYIKMKTRYIMSIWEVTFLPLQGFLNWFIYLYPRFVRLRKEHKNWSFCAVLANMFGGICKSRRHPAPNDAARPTAKNLKTTSSSAAAGTVGTGCNVSSASMHRENEDEEKDDDDNESMIETMLNDINGPGEDIGDEEDGRRQNPIAEEGPERHPNTEMSDAESEPTNAKKPPAKESSPSVSFSLSEDQAGHLRSSS